MDLYRIIGDLVEERNRVQRLIESLESMQAPGKAARPEGRGRKSMDQAARKEVSDRMKLYWAKRRRDALPETGT